MPNTTNESEPLFPTANIDPLEHYHRRMRALHRQQILSLQIGNELYKRRNWKHDFHNRWGF